MTPPDRLRALLAGPGFVTMPAVWDGLSAKLAAGAGFKTAFLSGSCVAASRLGGPDLDLLSLAEMFDSFNMVHGAAPETLILADGDHGYGNAMNVQRTVRAYGREAQPCLNCGVAMQRIKVGGRSSTFCPKCQPAARVAGARATRKVTRRPRLHARSAV